MLVTHIKSILRNKVNGIYIILSTIFFIVLNLGINIQFFLEIYCGIKVNKAFLFEIIKYKKKGIGKKLVESIISEIKIKVPKGEYATLNLISIAGMEKFYESCGLKAVPFDYNGKGMRMEIK